MNSLLTKDAALLLFMLTIGEVNSPGAPAQATVENKTRSAATNYEQQLYGPPAHLIAPEVAASTIRRFRAAYPQLGSPRFLLYVNRELIDQRTGLKLAGREETVVSTRREAARETVPSEGESPIAPTAPAPSPASASTGLASGGGLSELTTRSTDGVETPSPRTALSSTEKKVATVNRYERTEREEDSFEYRQLVREVELAFGRRLRSAGAALADQKIATALMADRPLRDFTTPTEGEQARKDREALAKAADVVLEILLVHRETIVARVSGNATLSQPEIQVTAIRLNDSRILGQASSADVLGSAAQQQKRLGQHHSSRDITDAVALYLMDDMMLGLNQN